MVLDKGVIAGNTHYIYTWGAIMLGFALIQVVFSVAAVYWGGKVAMSFGRDLRKNLFHKVTDFSAREVGTFGAPSLITRITNDVQQVQILTVMLCTMAVAAPTMSSRPPAAPTASGWGQRSCDRAGIWCSWARSTSTRTSPSAGKKITRSSYGGARPKRDFPWLARCYLDGRLKLDELITARLPLQRINEGFDAMRRGEGIRTVVQPWS